MINTIGIDNALDWQRIRHLFKIGIFAALLVLIGDMLLGWGAADESLTGVEGYFSRYLTVSDVRIFWSAMLGLVGIPLECLSYFGVYRLIAAKSEAYAHAYRAGIFGMLIFGAPVHVICCAAVYHFKALYAIAPADAAEGAVRFALYFLVPEAAVMAVFFFLLAIVQIRAFLQGATPLPKLCAVFSVLMGFAVVAAARLFGNHPAAYAVSTGWISFGSLWMLGGLLAASYRQRGK